MAGTNCLIVGGFAAGGSIGPTFIAAAGGFYEGVAPESLANTKFQSSASFSQLGINLRSAFDQTIVVFRNGGLNGNQTITYAINADTFQADMTHMDGIPAGAAVDVQYGSNTVINTLRYSTMSCNATLPLTWYGTGAAGGSGLTLPSTPHYANIQGSLNQNSPSTSWNDSTQSRLQAPGVLSFMGMMVGTAPTALVSATTYNGAPGNQALSFASGTGFMQDMTHTDNVSTGDDWGYHFSSANGSGTWTCMQSQFAGVTSRHDLGGATDNVQTTGPYFNFGGFFFWGGGVESEVCTGAPFAFTANLFRLRTFGGLSETATAVLRVNFAYGNETVSFASQTGLMMDVTHTDSLAAAELYDVSISGGGWASLFICGDDGSHDSVGGPFYHSFPP